MSVEERAQCRGLGSLERRQIGPSAQEITGYLAVQISFKELNHQRVIAFEHGAKLVEHAGIAIHKTPPSFHQQSQLARASILQLQRPQTFLVLAAHFTEQLSIAGIGLGAAHIKSPAEISQAPRVNGVNDQKVVLHQSVDECAARLLDANTDPALGMLLTQPQEELIQQLRLLLHRAGASNAVTGANGQNVGLASPIGTHPDIDGCRHRRQLRVRLNCLVVHSMIGWASRKNLTGRKPYRGPIKRQPLSIRIGQRKWLGAKVSPNAFTDMGRVIRHPSCVTLFSSATQSCSQVRISRSQKLFTSAAASFHRLPRR